jgi:sec-independent protein translocase protein TatA
MIFLAILALLLFGAKRLPEVGRSLGTGLREFKTTVTGMELGEPAAATHESVTHEIPGPAAEIPASHVPEAHQAIPAG